MASIKLTGDTSGVITVSAPAAAGTNTLTLPASTGTLLTTTGNGSQLTGITSGGLTLLSTLNTTSGTTATTSTLDLSSYKTLQVYSWSVGNSHASATPKIQWKNNGGTYTILSNNIETIDAYYGVLNLDLTTGTHNFSRSGARASGETVQPVNGAAGVGVNQITTTTTSISFAWTGGETFNAGKILIYGLK